MTQRTLTLLRHAKSSWKDPLQADIDRPLTKQGRREAKIMAPRLVEHGATFNTIFASPARRTRETIARMLVALPAQEGNVMFDSRFYTFERESLLHTLKQLDDSLCDVMIVGHNPALHDTLQWLTGESFVDFPTCAAAQITFDAPRWNKLREGCGQLMWVLVPKHNPLLTT